MRSIVTVIIKLLYDASSSGNDELSARMINEHADEARGRVFETQIKRVLRNLEMSP